MYKITTQGSQQVNFVSEKDMLAYFGKYGKARLLMALQEGHFHCVSGVKVNIALTADTEPYVWFHDEGRTWYRWESTDREPHYGRWIWQKSNDEDPPVGGGGYYDRAMI